MISRRKIALTLLLLCSAFSYAQNASLYEFNHLSSLYFSKQTDSLKKAWVCKEEFDKKVTQKKFKEIWDERTEFLIKSLKDNDYVYSSEIQAYLEGIVISAISGWPWRTSRWKGMYSACPTLKPISTERSSSSPINSAGKPQWLTYLCITNS